MRVWTPANIEKIRVKRKMTSLALERAMIRASPPYKLEPTNNHIRNIINGKVENPGVKYALLFADVLGCAVDDFVVDSCGKR